MMLSLRAPTATLVASDREAPKLFGLLTYRFLLSQVDQLVFEELMRERFPKLGLSSLFT